VQGMPESVRHRHGLRNRYGLLHAITLKFPRPRELTDGDVIQVLNSPPAAACLNARGFLPLADAAEKLENQCGEDNEIRPHRGIGRMPLIALMDPGGTTCPLPWLRPENSSSGCFGE